MNKFQQKYGPWALVTGASSGIGKEIATELAARGLNIVIVARRQKLLDELKQSIAKEHSVEVRTIPLDLTEADAITRIDAATQDLDIGLVVPNAGVAMTGEFVDTDPQRNENMVRLNMLAPMEMAHSFGRKLAARGSGGILFVSSGFGYQGIPYVANYAATKAYILTLGEALHVELGRHGVDVTVLSPGLTATAMPDSMPIDFNKLPMIAMKPVTVARTGINALGKKATVVPGLMNKFYVWENRLMPRSWPVGLFGFMIRRAIKHEKIPSIKAAATAR